MLIPHEIAYGLRHFFHIETPPGTGTAVQIKNPGAYLLYLRGLNALRQPDRLGLDDAINSFDRSLALDSTRAETYTGLAAALVSRNTSSQPGAGDLLEEAGEAALDGDQAGPTFERGLHRPEPRPDRTAPAPRPHSEMLDSAALRSPGESLIPFLRGTALFRSGRPEQALEILQKAFRLDPRNVEVLGLMATIHHLNKSFDRALWFRETAMHFTGDTLRYIAGPTLRRDHVRSRAATEPGPAGDDGLHEPPRKRSLRGHRRSTASRGSSR